MDLSSPHDGLFHSSINGLIDKGFCSLTYVKLDDAIKVIQLCGQEALHCKNDTADAFKQLHIKSSQWPLFCVKLNHMFYVYVRLFLGCLSSPKIFDTLYQAIS